jgi:predicted RNA binding protein YcfA (HicA-like mRNA interferase family)
MADYTRDVKQALKDAGWRLYRQGKGDHEIWESPDGKRRVSVDNAIVSRHWANRVLKWASLPKKF